MSRSIEQAIRDAAATLRSRAVKFAYLFGSYASGRARPGSDVDVAVYMDPAPAPKKIVDVTLEFAGLLAEASGIGDIDLVILNHASLPLLGRIFKSRIVVFSIDEPARVAFESRKMREFLDFDFHARALDEKLLKDMAEGRR